MTLAELADQIERAEAQLDELRQERNRELYRLARRGDRSLSALAREAGIGRSFAVRIVEGKGKPAPGPGRRAA